MRYEAPTSASRWDRPLFMVEHDDTLPFEGILDALSNKQVTANLSVQSVGASVFIYHRCEWIES